MLIRQRAVVPILSCAFYWASVVASPTNCSAADTRVEGFTEPYRQIELAVGEPGVLTEVLVKEGSRVQPGQKVAQLDTSVLERTLEIARQRSESVGALKAANAEFDVQTKYLQQLTLLRKRGHATQHELDRAAADAKVAEARVAIAEEELVLQRLECRRIEAQIQRRIIRSPLKGVVSEVLREAGESFMGNDPRVLTIVQLDRLRAKFSLDPHVALTMKPGQHVQLTVRDDARGLEGTIEMVSPVMDAKSGTVEVTVAIENPNGAIPSGARCWLQLGVSEHTTDGQTSYTSASSRD